MFIVTNDLIVDQDLGIVDQDLGGTDKLLLHFDSISW